MHRLLVLLVLSFPLTGLAADHVFGGAGASFEDPPTHPSNDAEAVRFLLQAGFGGDAAEIAEVQSLGYAGWIEAQIALPPSLQRPILEQTIAAAVEAEPRNGPFYRRHRMDQWFKTQLSAPDVLRQKLAYALSQILVVSDSGTLDNNPVGIAEYNDILLRNAFGNYKTLLSQVTHSPAMGVFLSHYRNQKTDWTMVNGALTPATIQPDENYAREVMQLFSIGLIERELDFSPLRDSEGNTIPTYDQDLITQTARALTGLSLQCSGAATVGNLSINRNCNCTGTACNFSDRVFSLNAARYAVPGIVTAVIHPDGYAPMMCFPRFADSGRSMAAEDGYAVLPEPHADKTLLAGITVAPSPVACHSGTPAADRQTCITYCEDQVDTVVTSLAEHPNVAPFMARQLIQRLVTSNPSPGYIQRVAQVFVDDGSGQRGNLTAVVKAVLLDWEARNEQPAQDFGKLREPMLRLLAVWRAFDAVPSTTGIVGLFTPEGVYQQRPLGAPSVFNFYSPDYKPPGEMQTAGLRSPEMQITSESSVVTTSDDLWLRLFAGYGFQSGGATTFNPPANQAYIPVAGIDALPDTSTELVEALNQRLMYGRMSDFMRSQLVGLVDGPMATADARRKALNLIHLIAISPEFVVQR
ncbi:MAG: hypothetical protein BWZ07_01886 [Alphaproteobacteria bacterium ADurb.BinA280]|nr:DUF1800 family protein [Xanthomonadales bacterium]OPZ11640.1 MAG: hypothetical protein BWZ07_01886 [Alphaproteobacteria bacterium ADurb.BinA280]